MEVGAGWEDWEVAQAGPGRGFPSLMPPCPWSCPMWREAKEDRGPRYRELALFESLTQGLAQGGQAEVLAFEAEKGLLQGPAGRRVAHAPRSPIPGLLKAR